ncbi:hypothetical protein L3V79_04980 [Thiotrichales bacterium 19S9-12]|nr:hypothetical protein [Thiotrichales bacterium 19S9-11]MCF6811711.1 hypothetical protein [Thiotrichales bacterium 19S9-12]
MKILVITSNNGNKSQPLCAVNQLIGEFPDGYNKPDIIVITEQESSSNMATSLISQLNESDNAYQDIHSNEKLVMTKPFEFSYMRLTIAIRHELANKLKIEFSEEETSLNKGGLLAGLTIGNKKIGVICAHLDSHDITKRQEKLDDIMTHFPENAFDGVILSGDLNERLPITDKINKNDLSTELLKKDPLSQGTTHASTKYNFHFEPLNDFSYTKMTESGNHVNQKESRGFQVDIGALDNVGIKNKEESETPTLKITNPPCAVALVNDKGEQVSDHKTVICCLELETNLESKIQPISNPTPIYGASHTFASLMKTPTKD